MKTIIKQSESRFTNFLVFLFLLGLGVIPVWLAGGITGWLCFALFAAFSLLPLWTVIQPKTSLLAVKDGKLVWWTAQQGQRIEEASVPIETIRKVIKLSQPGRRSVEIQLVLADSEVLFLPEGLLPEVNAKKIISAIKGLSETITVEELDTANERDDTLPGDAKAARPARASAGTGKPKAENGWTLNDRNVWKYTLGFVIVGVALLGTAVILGISTYRFIRAASSTNGTVQNLVWSSTGSGHGVYQPIVLFADQSGQARTFTESGSNPPDFRVGQQVRVIYDPNDPSHANIYSFQTLWLLQTCMGILGLLFTTMGSFATWQARKLYAAPADGDRQRSK